MAAEFQAMRRALRDDRGVAARVADQEAQIAALRANHKLQAEQIAGLCVAAFLWAVGEVT
jgi:hypothetical protein